MIFNNILSSNQRQAVEGYLSQKWAILLDSNVTNPFSNTALSPQTVLTTPRISLASANNIGYQVSPPYGNPGTSILYYDGYTWSLN
jgi:hypothetical protein